MIDGNTVFQFTEDLTLVLAGVNMASLASDDFILA
jgi:hypothetical protein